MAEQPAPDETVAEALARVATGASETRHDKRMRKRAVVEDRVLLVRRLLTLDGDVLASLPVPADVLVELELSRQLKASAAKRRQIRYTASLLAGRDAEIVNDLHAFDAGELDVRSAADRWRELLVSDDAAFQAFVTHAPTADRRRVRQLVRRIRTPGSPPGPAARLTAYLKTLDLPMPGDVLD